MNMLINVKKNTMVVFLWATLSCIVLTSFQASANVVHISEKQLNDTIIKSFPLKLAYPSFTVWFEQPGILLNPLEEALNSAIKLKVMVRATNNQENLTAYTILKGQIRYIAKDKLLRLEDIEMDLDKFNLIEGSENASILVRQIKQSAAKILPKIILIDFEQLDTQHLLKAPVDISVAPHKIIVKLKN